MMRSILEYASAVWDPHLFKDKSALERVQRRAARFIKMITTYTTRIVTNTIVSLK